jgi:hypothetical protein
MDRSESFIAVVFGNMANLMRHKIETAIKTSGHENTNSARYLEGLKHVMVWFPCVAYPAQKKMLLY